MSHTNKPAIDVPKRIVEKTVSPISREFVFSTLISTNTHEQGFFAPMKDLKVPFYKGIGDTGTELINRLINLPGVKKVSIQPYEISVLKCDAVDWSVIMDTIREIVLDVVFRNDANVAVDKIEEKK